MATVQINLAVLGKASEWARVPQHATKVSVEIIVGSAFSFGQTVDLQHSFTLGDDEQGRSLESAQNFDPAIQFNSTTPYRRNVSCSGAGHVRVFTTATDGTGDQRAVAVMVFT